MENLEEGEKIRVRISLTLVNCVTKSQLFDQKSIVDEKSTLGQKNEFSYTICIWLFCSEILVLVVKNGPLNIM